MANLIIKPTSGGSLILQDEGGTAAHTIDASGNHTLANNTTLSGTANNIGTVTTGNLSAVSDCAKLYSNVLSSATAAVNVNGYFDNTKYAYYKFIAMGLRTTSTGGNMKFRVMTGGSVNTGSIYWSAGGGDYSNNGTVMAMNRADQDGANYAGADCTWDAPTGAANSTANYEFTFSEPQNATYHKTFGLTHWRSSHATGDQYTAVEHIVISARTTTALTGVSIFPSTSTLSRGIFTLYGFRK